MSENRTDCPSKEELNSFHDGEDNASVTHIADCQACRDILEAYDRVDELVKSAMVPPSGLSERICRAVREGCVEKTRPFPWWRSAKVWRHALSAAAALVILLSVALHFQQKDRTDSGEQTASTTTTVTVAKKSVIESESVETQLPEPSTMRINLAATATRPENIRLIGLRGTGNAAYGVQEHHRYTIPSRVNHVWSVRNLESAQAYINSYARMNDKVVSIGQRKERNISDVVIVLNDRELQDLVDKLSAEHWSLLSPVLPQPGKNALMQLTGKRVEYKLSMVTEE